MMSREKNGGNMFEKQDYFKVRRIFSGDMDFLK